MSVTELAARLSAVDDDTGARIEERRLALGLSVKALAERAGIDRGVLSRIEKGEGARATSVRLIERALDEFERERGMDLPSVVQEQQTVAPGVVRIEVQGVYGAKALILEAPPENLDELKAMVDQIMKSLRDDQDRDQGEVE